jgi:hypothetical protein
MGWLYPAPFNSGLFRLEYIFQGGDTFSGSTVLYKLYCISPMRRSFVQNLAQSLVFCIACCYGIHGTGLGQAEVQEIEYELKSDGIVLDE